MVERKSIGASDIDRLVSLMRDARNGASSGHTTPAGNKVLEGSENVFWGGYDPFGNPKDFTIRDIGSDLQDAEIRIEDARASLEDTQVRLEDAEHEAEEAQKRLDTIETTTLPEVRDEIQAAADQAAEDLTTLEGNLATAKQDLADAKVDLGILETDLATEAEARQQLASDVQSDFTELDTRLNTFGDDPALEGLRTQLSNAQDAASNATEAAEAANTAASAASQAALEAAGIAASKGRVIVSETEPVGEDRKSSNIWIKPVPDDPDTEVEEKAITYVYLEASNEWQATTSSELAQAAQNALDAREAAQQAQQRADTAISNAATAQSAAEAAQATADEATTDARDAHNEAVAAQASVDAKIAAGDSLVLNGSFELDTPAWEEIEGRFNLNTRNDAHSGTRVMRLTPATVNAYPMSERFAVRAGSLIHVQMWYRYFSVDGLSRLSMYFQQFDKDGAQVDAGYAQDDGGSLVMLFADDLVRNSWTLLEGVIPIAEGVTHMSIGPHALGASTDVFHIDDLLAVDVTEVRKARERADEAYAEAESKLSEDEVQAIADAAKSAAVTAAAADATAKAEQAEADAAIEAARVAQEKADAAEADAALTAQEKADAAQTAAEAWAKAEDESLEARAAQDASDKADQALADAQDALDAARGEITTEINASANGKNSITRSRYDPSADGVIEGDAWYRVDANGDAFGMWIWDGSSWVASKVRNEMIDTLDLNKLVVADEATMDNAVIDKLWVDGIVGKAATFNQINVASGNIIVDPQGLNPELRNNIGGSGWSWDVAGKYWKRPAVQGGTTQFYAYSNVGSVYDSNLLTPDAMYVISFEVWVDSVGPDTAARAAIYWKGVDDNTHFVGDAIEEGGDDTHWDQPMLAGQWNKVERHWRAPADTSSGGFNFQLIRGGEDSTEVRVRKPFVGLQAASVMIEDGAVNAQKVQAESVAGAVGKFLEIEAGQLTAGEATIDEGVINKLWVDGLVGKSVTASQVAVAAGNLLPNGTFVDGSDSGWTAAPEATVVSVVGPDALPATHALKAVQTNTLKPYSGPMIPIEPEEQYLFEVWMIADKPDSRIYVELRDENNNHASSNNEMVEPSASGTGSYLLSSEPVPTIWTKYQTVVNATSSQAKIGGIYYNHSAGSERGATVYMTGFSLRKRTGAVLIEDGAVSTPKLNVTEQMTAKLADFMSVATKKLIVSDEAILNHATLIGQTVVDDINVQGTLIGNNGVFTGTVDFENINVTGTQIVNEIGANSIEASKIKGGSFSGKSFTGGEFVGGAFATSIRPYDDGGVWIDANRGIRGWAPNSAWDEPTFQLNPDTGETRIRARLLALNEQDRGVMLIPTTNKGGGGLWFTDDGTGSGAAAAIWRSEYNPNEVEPLNIRGANGGPVVAHGGFQVHGGGILTEYDATVGNIWGYGSELNIKAMGAEVRLRHDGAPQLVSKTVYDRTYSSSANVHVTSFGTLGRTSSSRRYKKNIVDWSPEADRVLALQPRQWQHDDPENNPEIDETWQVGFVAEEVDDLGLKGLVDYAGDGKGGWRPEALRYDRFAAAHQVVLKKHEQEITDLRAENDDLRNRLERLEALLTEEK